MKAPYSPAVLALCFYALPLIAQNETPAFTFRDVAKSSGILPAAEKIHAHGAAWGDVDGDSFPDLYLGTFHKSGTKPNFLFLNNNGKSFTLDPAENLKISTRATGIVFADLDNDGDLDLYIASMPKAVGKKSPNEMRGCSLFENTGEEKVDFEDRSKNNGACPEKFGGRSVAVFDYDGDGLLDLLVAEDPNSGYNGSPTSSTRLFKNLGDLKFEDSTNAAKIPADIPGLGVAAADVNNDTFPDFFIASADGGNQLFLNHGDGTFHEYRGNKIFSDWEGSGGDSMVCGVAFGDLNRDGLMDMVLGQHFEKPWQVPEANRVFINEGTEKDGSPLFKNATAEVGLIPIPMKSPHVEIQDFDNDGWMDISTSTVTLEKDGTPHPVIFKNTGLQKNELPKFIAPALSLNDFPTKADQEIGSTGKFFDKMLADRKITYSAPGPVADYDRDGRLDILIPSWWPETDTMLLHNETDTTDRHWIRIGLDLSGDQLNRAGIGTRIEVYPAGKIGKIESLIAVKEIATGFGYASGQPASAHIGLGEIDSVDIRLVFPHAKGTANFEKQSVDLEVILKN